MPVEELYIHVGTPKTGTSSLQVDFIDYRKFYGRHGLSYFEPYRRGYAHHPIAHDLRRGKLKEVRAVLAEGIKAEPSRRTIISSEMLYFNDVIEKLLSCLPDEYLPRAHVIMYVRRQDLYLESLAKQHKKDGTLKGTMHDYMRTLQHQGNYASVLERIKSASPATTVSCRLFDSSRMVGGDIISDFRHFIGVPVPKHPKQDDHWARNASPCRELAEASGNYEFPDIQTRKRVLGRVVAKEPSLVMTRDILSAEERRSLMESYRDENRRLSAFCGIDMEALFFGDVDFEAESRAAKSPEESRRLREYAEVCLRREYDTYLADMARQG